MTPDPRLEELSEKVRLGIPISLVECVEVIDYQAELRKNKKPSMWKRLLEVFK